MVKLRDKILYWGVLIAFTLTTFIGIFISIVGIRARKLSWFLIGIILTVCNMYLLYFELFGLFFGLLAVSLIIAIIIRKKYHLHRSVVREYKIDKIKNKEKKDSLKKIRLLSFRGVLIDSDSDYNIRQEVLDFHKSKMFLLRVEWGNLGLKINNSASVAYYNIFNSILDTFNIEFEIKLKIQEVLKSNLGLRNIKTEKNISKSMKILNKKYKVRKGFFRVNKYKLLVVMCFEFAYLKFILQNFNINQDQIESIVSRFELSKKDKNFMEVILNNLFINKNYKMTLLLLSNSDNNEIGILKNFVDAFVINEKYLNKENVNISVLATMSAGKSTLINALLGKEYIPSRNEACTAKVTSIYDNDNIERIIGYSKNRLGDLSYKVNITLDDLRDWNDDELTETIVLERDLEGIDSNNRTLVISDTPGTNYSQDITHVENTFDFLEKIHVNIILFVINACKIQSTDNDLLLRKVKAQFEKKETRIIFLLNKIDNFDYEKEDDINSSILSINQHLEEVGFKDNRIIPISAYAGYLFKKALSNQEFSKKESIDFRGMFMLFYKENIDLRKYALNTNTRINKSNVNWGQEECKVYKWTFKKENVEKALKNSGIMSLESVLEEMIN